MISEVKQELTPALEPDARSQRKNDSISSESFALSLEPLSSCGVSWRKVQQGFTPARGNPFGTLLGYGAPALPKHPKNTNDNISTAHQMTCQ
jgi:hypothetical protein